MDGGASQQEYIRRVLDAYRKTPGAIGLSAVRTAQLYQLGIPVSVIETHSCWRRRAHSCGPPMPRHWARFVLWLISYP
jgi:hypothetical protein